jgi:two-component system sensor histidine kinase ChiS
LGKQRILVVDDDPIFTKTTKAVLETHGYMVDIAQDGSEALATMGHERPDLVVLDVMMDWLLEGVTISQEMMKRRELRSIPIVMISSIQSSEHQAVFPRDQYLHIDTWLDKPFHPDRLVAEIAKTLARHRQYQEGSC